MNIDDLRRTLDAHPESNRIRLLIVDREGAANRPVIADLEFVTVVADDPRVASAEVPPAAASGTPVGVPLDPSPPGPIAPAPENGCRSGWCGSSRRLIASSAVAGWATVGDSHFKQAYG